jgi:hypothetical protein
VSRSIFMYRFRGWTQAEVFLSFLRACCYIQIHYQIMHIIKNIHSLHFKNYTLKCLWYILKIKIKNPTCFGHCYSTIIRGSHCLCIYYYQCACNILYVYVAVCYLCACTCGVLARTGITYVSVHAVCLPVRALPMCLYMRCACPVGHYLGVCTGGGRAP